LAADRGKRLTRELLYAAFVGPSRDTDDPRILDRLVASVEAQTLRPGDVLYREGDVADHVYFMTEGRVRLSRAGRADWIYEGHWVIGTTDVLARRTRTRTAVVESETQFFSLPTAAWFAANQDQPETLLDAFGSYVSTTFVLYSKLAPDGGFPPASVEPIEFGSLAARAEVLGRIPLFEGLRVQILLELARSAELSELDAGQVLFPAGKAAGRVHIVLDGLVEARRSEPDVAATFGPGSLVAGLVSLSDVDRAWSAAAVTRAQTMSFRTDDLYDHVEEHLDAMRALMAGVALERERLFEETAARAGELVLR
jgi:CRP-like cAMP-binding protein